MELDKRIKEGKRPLTCFDVKEAKQFISKEGFFSNKEVDFQDLNDACRAVLEDVLDSYDNTPPLKHSNDFRQNLVETYCFVSSVSGYKYFLPAEWVPEPKYRPYKDYDEMSQDFSVGQIIDYIDKDFNCIHQAEIVEAFTNSAGETYVGIGHSCYALSAWFESIEVKDPETDQWVPFGVKE